MVKAALKARRRRPILLIDSGSAGRYRSAIARLDDAFRLRWTIWSGWRSAGRQHRASEAEDAWRIVDQSVAVLPPAADGAGGRPRRSRRSAPAFRADRAEVLASPASTRPRRRGCLINRLLHSPKLALEGGGGPTSGSRGGCAACLALNAEDQRKVSLEPKLDRVLARHDELAALLAGPDRTMPAPTRATSKEYSDLRPRGGSDPAAAKTRRRS